MNRVDGKVAIVTGGGSGIGAATSKLLAEAGAKVVVTDIDALAAGEIAKEILEDGGDALALHHDVTDELAWDEVVDHTLADYTRLDILVNNAGVSGAGMGAFEDQTLAQWHSVLSVNLDSVFMGSRKAVLSMKDSGGGSIVNISSVFGIVGGSGAAYNASKGGVRLLTKSIAVHCGNMGYPIRVNSVHPGFIWTPLVRAIVDARPAEENMTEEGLRAMLTERHPIGRLGEAEDVAKAILFLASDDSSFMTGSELVIDGGYTAV
jgi:NAD(P)-dependent dehydrogenase (short-subunit alcohol dehydrogenase family)